MKSNITDTLIAAVPYVTTYPLKGKAINTLEQSVNQSPEEIDMSVVAIFNKMRDGSLMMKNKSMYYYQNSKLPRLQARRKRKEKKLSLGTDDIVDAVMAGFVSKTYLRSELGLSETPTADFTVGPKLTFDLESYKTWWTSEQLSNLKSDFFGNTVVDAAAEAHQDVIMKTASQISLANSQAIGRGLRNMDAKPYGPSYEIIDASYKVNCDAITASAQAVMDEMYAKMLDLELDWADVDSIRKQKPVMPSQNVRLIGLLGDLTLDHRTRQNMLLAYMHQMNKESSGKTLFMDWTPTNDAIRVSDLLLPGYEDINTMPWYMPNGAIKEEVKGDPLIKSVVIAIVDRLKRDSAHGPDQSEVFLNEMQALALELGIPVTLYFAGRPRLGYDEWNLTRFVSCLGLRTISHVDFFAAFERNPENATIMRVMKDRATGMRRTAQYDQTLKQFV